jgi:hypothetical protein
MRNRSPVSRKVWLSVAKLRPIIFVEPSRPCGDFAPSPTPWALLESTHWRRKPSVALRTGQAGSGD